MKLLVAGGTGFIGAPLCRELAQHGHDVTVVTRQPERHRPAERPLDAGPGLGRGPLLGMSPQTRRGVVPSEAQPSRGTTPWSPGFAGGAPLRFVSWDGDAWKGLLAEAGGVVNLAGESIAAGRWTARRKLELQESRLQTTRRLVDAMASGSTRPACLVNASAIGYYGARGDEPLDERTPPGRGFLAELCRAWEAEARRAEPLGVRVVVMRIGLVLGPGGGALARMVPPFRWGIGGPLGSGRQWMSWIHREDVIGITEWALSHPDVSGPVNVTAPQPITMQALCAMLGRALRRPSWALVPSAALRLLLGEMAEVILSGQRVLPRAALDHGYGFRYPELEPALRDCLSSGGAA